MSELPPSLAAVESIVLEQNRVVRSGHSICWVCHYEVSAEDCIPIPGEEDSVWCSYCRQDEQKPQCVICGASGTVATFPTATLTFHEPKPGSTLSTCSVLSACCSICLSNHPAPVDIIEGFRERKSLWLGKAPRVCPLCRVKHPPEFFITRLNPNPPGKRQKIGHFKKWYGTSACIVCVNRKAPPPHALTRKYCWRCWEYYPCYRQIITDTRTMCCPLCANKISVKNAKIRLAANEDAENRPVDEMVEPDCVGFVTKMIPRLVERKEREVKAQIAQLDTAIAASKATPRLVYNIPEYNGLTTGQQQALTRYRNDTLKALDDVVEIRAETQRLKRYTMFANALLAALPE